MTLTVVYRSNLLYLGSSTGNASSMPTAAMANMNRSTKSPCQDWMAKLKLQRTSPMVTPDRPDRQMLARTFNICQRRQITAYAQDRAATPNRRMKPKKGPDHPILADRDNAVAGDTGKSPDPLHIGLTGCAVAVWAICHSNGLEAPSVQAMISFADRAEVLSHCCRPLGADW
jgi:hypothetical protein